MKKYTFKRSLLTILVIINTVFFVLFSTLHFYWAFGGKRLYHDVLPTSSNGLNKFSPGTAASLIVAFGFLLMTLITVGSQGWFDKYIKRTYLRQGILIVAILFFLRSIGDFKFIGFFKMIRLTRFGINDTQIFSPLCLFICLISLLIFVFNKNRP